LSSAANGQTVLVIDDSPTILKVVQLVLSKAGYHIATASDGEQGVAAARLERPDLILLDFVMPKMNGYQVCRALSADPQLRDIPVVLMSAKGDQVGERFVKVMGIVDYITKPFSPEAITAVVTHTIGKYVRRAPAPDAPVVDADNLDVEQTGEDLGARDLDDARGVILDEVRNAVADAVAPKIAGLVQLAVAVTADGEASSPDARVPTDPDAIADVARTALDDATLARILAAIRPGLFVHEAPRGDDEAADEPVLSGDLRLIPIAEVLQLLQAQAHSGVLAVTRARGRVDVCFRQGRVDFAAANGIGDEFLIGRFIVALQLMSKPDLEAFARVRGDGGPRRASPAGPGWSEAEPPDRARKPLGQQLVKLGYISEAELKQAVAKQTCELVYEILRWNFGQFAFRATRDLPPLAVDAALGLEVDGILMEGFRRVDEWHLIEREIENFDLVFLRNEDAVAQMGRGRLTREEQTILELVNGKNTVKEIIRQSRMGSFDVSKMLYRLLSIKLIRRRVMPVAV
jgi:CheY-like chemotaxis protein